MSLGLSGIHLLQAGGQVGHGSGPSAIVAADVFPDLVEHSKKTVIDKNAKARQIIIRTLFLLGLIAPKNIKLIFHFFPEYRPFLTRQ